MSRVRRYLGEIRAVGAAPSVARQATLEVVLRRVLHGLGFGNADATRNGELRAAREVLGAVAGRRAVVFDVGANSGDYTAMLLDAFDSDLDVYCFEPSPTACEGLARRLADSLQVRVLNVGLSNEEQEAVLHADALGSGCGSLYDRAVFRQSVLEPIRLRRLDAVCDELGVGYVDLLKVDAEGHDLFVLQGAGELLAERRIGAVQFEHGGTAPDARVFLRDFFDVLESTHRLHRILPDGLWPLDRYKEDVEISLYANYLALPRAG